MANRTDRPSGPGGYHPGLTNLLTPVLTRRDLLRFSGLVVAGGALGTFGAAPAASANTIDPVKTGASFYTPEKVAALRRNVERFDWARAVRDARVKEAAPWLGSSDEWLWNSVTGQGLPRSYAVNEPLGSPTSGTDIYRYGRQPWRADPFNRPWKLIDPVSGHVFPTNDFAKFYASGLDEHGQFHRDRADRSLLVNELYPERGASWGVDDGFGWVDDNGDKWTFIAYYNFFVVWFAVTTTPSLIWAGLIYLRDAFLFTGDLRYAHAGLILLDRVADVFPAMDTGAYRRQDGYLVSDGLSGKGKVVGSIWDCDLTRELLSVYDAFFPAIADTDEAGVLPFLSEQARRYGLPPKDSPAAVRRNIENGLYRVMFPAVKDAQIRGNFGMHQSALAMAAVVLDDPVASKEWIDWIFASGGVVYDPDIRLTGGNVYASLVDDVDRDGFGNEGSAQYNQLWLGQVRGVADILSDYQGYDRANLYAHPKMRKLVGSRHRLWMLNRYTPGVGDTGRTGMPDLFSGPHEYFAHFERLGDPAYAQIAHLLSKGDVGSIYGSLFSADVAESQDRIRRIVAERGELNLPSENLTGFGFAALRAGRAGTMRGVWSYYGRNHGHGHADALNLGLYGFGVDLAPDLGYPETADGSAREVEWHRNTIAHNTVVVDASRQRQHWVGRPHGFLVTDRVRMLDIAAPQVYPQTSTYRRVTAMVDIDEANWYVVDVFRVAGGEQHHFSFHGAEGAVNVQGLTLTPQPTGTYAGPEVQPPADNARPRPDANGFDWLFNVERDNAPEAGFSVDWAVRDTWNVHPDDPDLHLRLTMLTDVDDVALADGIPARNQPGNPKKLRYLIARRAGQGLASQFVALIEPYSGTRPVRSVRAVPVRAADGTVAGYEAAAVRVELADGRVDYVVSCARPDALLRVDDGFLFRGSFGVYSLRDGEPVYACHHEGTLLGPLPHLSAGHGAVTGRVADFTRELSTDNQLVLTLDRTPSAGEQPDRLVGGYVYVDNDGERNAVYRIDGARLDGDSRLVLDIGDTTTVRRYRAPRDFTEGFVYDVAVGARARIPLTREWVAR
ncbi:heparinase II/III domain-containing protein [Micromonospora sp. LZ34]